MRKEPMMDPRTKQDVLREIEKKSRVYTPEWRFAGETEDAGGALSGLFSGLFSETIARYNGFPKKSYLDFLNLLDVRQSPVTPAHGTVQFTVDTGEDGGNVYIPAGTQLYSSVTAGEESIPYFETDSSIEAVPAALLALYCVDPEQDHICEQPLDAQSIPFFITDPETNRQQHRFSFTQQDIFLVSRPTVITLRLEHVTSYYTPICLTALANDSICRWTYRCGEEEKPFTRVYEKDGLLHLEKDNHDPISTQRLVMPEAAAGEETEEAPMPEVLATESIFCTLLPGASMPELRVKTIQVSSRYLDEDSKEPDTLYFNEDPIEDQYGAYCFGRQPGMYDCFYLSSGEVLGKRGARIHISMDIKTAVVEQMTAEEQYEFKKKYIIDKGDKAKSVKKMFISQIVWEYWNGVGWKSLKLEGDQNPFSCQNDGEKNIWFHCPADMQKTDVNAEENYWLRARVAFIENLFDDKADIYLPLVQGIRLDYSYDSMQPVNAVQAVNNCKTVNIANAESVTVLDMCLYEPLPDAETAEYFLFDKPFSGHPMALHFEMLVNDDNKRALEFEVLHENGFQPVRMLDDTDQLQKSGIISLFINRSPAEAELFGERGYWLRLLDKGARYRKDTKTKLLAKAVVVNAVNITQKRTMPPELFETDLFEANKELLLAEGSVLSAAVWVNEQQSTDAAAIEALMHNEPQNIRRELDDSGALSALWVRWSEVASFYQSGPEDRHYTLDYMDGRIRFGDGRKGMVPPSGGAAIRVEYTTGGGVAGNLPANSVDTLTGGIPNVTSVNNAMPCCGGNDMQSLETLMRVGPMRLRHRNRVLTAEDYENIVQELFGQVRDVRCFAGRDAGGNEAPGHVTVVVMAQEYENDSYARLLAEDVMRELSRRCDMNLLAQGFLHVIPASVITVSCSMKLLLPDYHDAVLTERDVCAALADMIKNKRVAGHFIGNLPNRSDVYAALKSVANVISAEDVMLRGEYFADGKHRVISLNDGTEGYPYTVAVSGDHKINF